MTARVQRHIARGTGRTYPMTTARPRVRTGAGCRGVRRNERSLPKPYILQTCSPPLFLTRAASSERHFACSVRPHRRMHMSILTFFALAAIVVVEEDGSSRVEATISVP